jgi:superfamily II DNA or RNA helicase
MKQKRFYLLFNSRSRRFELYNRNYRQLINSSEGPYQYQALPIPQTLNLTPLYEYQKTHTSIMLENFCRNGTVLDNSDAGTGKTVIALVICRELKVPFFIITSKPVLDHWNSWITRLGIDSQCLGVVNYQLIRVGKYYNNRMMPIKCPYFLIKPNTHREIKYDSKFQMIWNLPANTMIIFDEVHRTKNKGTLTSQLLIQAADQHFRIYMISATIGENPLAMYGFSRALGFWEQPWEFYSKFARSFGCVKNKFGWEFVGGIKAIENLRDTLIASGKAHGIRVNDLIRLGLFPESQTIPYLVDLKNPRINDLYDQMHEELVALKTQEISIFFHHDVSNGKLPIRQKNLQRIELLKIPIIVEMTNDYIDQGYSVVIFVNYTQSVEALADRLHTTCTFHGKNTYNQNKFSHDAFQQNRSRVIICNTASGSESIDLHDQLHQHPRISIIAPNDSPTQIKQCQGRIHRIGGTRSIQYIVYANDSIERKVFHNLMVKLHNIDLLNEMDTDRIKILEQIKGG